MILDLKNSEFLKGFFNLFVFGLLFTTMIFCGEENIIFIEVRFRNLMTYVFKGHVKIANIYMVKFNV